MPTEKGDENNKEYASAYADGRSSHFAKEVLATSPLGYAHDPESISGAAFRKGVEDQKKYGYKPYEACGDGESDEPVTSDEPDDSSSCCYIVGACLDELNLPRNSLEMKSMQKLANEHILKSFRGKRDYVRYGQIGPRIVKNIRASPNSKRTWSEIYHSLREVVNSVGSEKYEQGYNQYKSIVLGLEDQFLR